MASFQTSRFQKVKIYVVFFTLFNLTFVSCLYGQVTFDKRAGGPIGAAPKIGDFNQVAGLDNVEFCTGTVNATIPLFEIKAHDITVPISISYSALGLKVGQEAGPTGMGWELNAGGKIIRQVNGLLDDADPARSVNSTNSFMLNPDDILNDRNKLKEVMLGNADYAYDIFSYTLPTSGGRFTQNGLTFPYDPTFKYDINGSRITTGDGMIHNFTAGDGIIVSRRKFYEPANDGTSNMRRVEHQAEWFIDVKSYTSDFNLANIISSRFKDTVKFEYESIASLHYTNGIPAKTRLTSTETISLTRKLAQRPDNSWYDIDGMYYFVDEPIIGQTKVEIYRHERIKTITYATGKVFFEYSAIDALGRDVITSITVYQKLNTVLKWLKRYEFNYDPDVQYGHYLETVDVLDAAGIKAGKWKFSYYGTSTPYAVGKLPVVPSSGSKAQDRWGFYNGETDNKTLLEQADSLINLRDIPHLMASNPNYPGHPVSIFTFKRTENREFYSPTDQNTTQLPFAKRHFSFSQAIKGTLKSITTPTGESVNYEYESNSYQIKGYRETGYNTFQSYDRIYQGGGIRIKSIWRRDGIAFSGKTISQKNYTYGVGGPSSTYNTATGYGIVNIPGIVLGIVYKYASGSSTHNVENLQYLSHPLNDLSLYKGSYAYYPSVTESIRNGFDINGETVYYFGGVETGPWNHTVAGSVTQLNMPEFYTNQGVKLEAMIGKPYQVSQYAGNRLSGIKINETKYAYSNFKAPANSPKLYSYFGGVKGMLIGRYSSSFSLCLPTPVTGAGLVWKCTDIGNVPNMDPSGYRNFGPESNENYYPGKYYGTTVELSSLSNVYKLTATRASSYDLAGLNPTLKANVYYYDNITHLQPTRIASVNSNSDSTVQRIKYAQDFLNNTVDGVALLRGKNRVTEQVEGLAMVKKNGAYQVTAGVKNTFRVSGSLVVNDKSYRLNTGGKLTPLTNYTEVDSRYELESSYDVYDEMGNLTLFSNVNSPKTAVFWGYKQQYPIAQVVNAASAYDVAFTNFESADKGYWIYSGVPVLDITSPAADNVYNLAGKPITKTYYTAGKKYLLAYWYKTGAVITVTGGVIGAPIIKNTRGNWLFAEREMTLSGTLTISGTGFIDELQFYPADAQMSSYAYNNGIGIIRAQDAKGQSVTYEYDNEQRLKYIKDQQGNILKAYDFNIGNQYK
ncbi:MAG: hypothetical protein ACOH2A_05570 [Sphingobacteriaceae bacterium]